MVMTILEFEKPLIELEAKIEELQKFTVEKGIDFSEEIQGLEKKAHKLKSQIYSSLSPYQRVLLARHSERPTTIDYINTLITDFIELHGDRNFGDDLAIIGGIGRFNGIPVTVIGHQKGKDTKDNVARNFGMPHPEGYRKALRLMEQAEKFNRPVICFVDTKGANPGIGAEERGQGEALARNLLVMSQLKVPIVCVVIGEGGSGGALALSIGDRIMMLENSIYSVSTPEAFVSILYKVEDPSRIPDAADVMKLTAQDILGLKIIDEVIPEPLGGAHRDFDGTAENIKESLTKWFEEVKNEDIDTLLEKRYQKFRGIGQVISG